VPHSSHLGVTLMLEHVVRMQPRRVLDIGVGFGKWGLLVREALDFMPGRIDKQDWQVEIDGIDAFPYDSPLHAWVYDSVRTANVVDVAEELTGYDLVVLGDVIEHLEKAEGLSLLRKLLASNRNALVSTPAHFFEQEVERNLHERHLSYWQPDDFREWTCDFDVVSAAVLVVALAGKDATYPTAADGRASRLAYSVPLVRDRGSVARVVKGLLRALPGPK